MIKRDFQFYRNDNGIWYISLPDWPGDADDLQMIEGADKWLALMGGDQETLTVTIASSTFNGAEFLTLIRLGEENLGGGGNYFLKTYQDSPAELKVWLCKVVKFIFNEYPQRLYFCKI